MIWTRSDRGQLYDSNTSPSPLSFLPPCHETARRSRSGSLSTSPLVESLARWKRCVLHIPALLVLTPPLVVLPATRHHQGADAALQVRQRTRGMYPARSERKPYTKNGGRRSRAVSSRLASESCSAKRHLRCTRGSARSCRALSLKWPSASQASRRTKAGWRTKLQGRRALATFSSVCRTPLTASSTGSHGCCSPWLAGLAAGTTEAIAVVCPMEVVKIRLQAQQHSLVDPLEAPRYRNAAHAAYTIIREEGLSTLYRGVSLTALRQATNQGERSTLVACLAKSEL